MSRLLGMKYGKTSTTDIPEWTRADWAGRHLRLFEVVPPTSKGIRPRLDWGMQLRVYPVRREYLVEVLGEEAVAAEEAGGGPGGHAPPEAVAFCRGCAPCPYAATCPLIDGRTRWEASRRGRPGPVGPPGRPGQN